MMTELMPDYLPQWDSVRFHGECFTGNVVFRKLYANCNGSWMFEKNSS